MEVNENRENPFTPTFGEVPAHLAGRRPVIEGAVKAFESSRRRPELTMVLSGARGTGKTTLLSLISQEAEKRGWVAVGVTAVPGMLEDIEIRVAKRAAHLLDAKDGFHVTSIGIPQIVDVSFSEGDKPLTNWRSRMEDALESLEAHSSGLVITVDEIDVALDEVIQLATVYQHFVREGRRVSLIMAGLPNNVSSLLNDKSVSFLRRSQVIQLEKIEDFETEDALRKTIRDGGRATSECGLKEAVRAIGGFPFMLQLVGFRAWDENPSADIVSDDDFTCGIRVAREELKSRILYATYRELSDNDIAFLRAMLEDEGESRICDLTSRLGWSSSQIAQYRRRLIEAGIIGQRRRGVVGFDMPFFREYLQECGDTSFR